MVTRTRRNTIFKSIRSNTLPNRRAANNRIIINRSSHIKTQQNIRRHLRHLFTDLRQHSVGVQHRRPQHRSRLDGYHNMAIATLRHARITQHTILRGHSTSVAFIVRVSHDNRTSFGVQGPSLRELALELMVPNFSRQGIHFHSRFFHTNTIGVANRRRHHQHPTRRHTRHVFFLLNTRVAQNRWRLVAILTRHITRTLSHVNRSQPKSIQGSRTSGLTTYQHRPTNRRVQRMARLHGRHHGTLTTLQQCLLQLVRVTQRNSHQGPNLAHRHVRHSTTNTATFTELFYARQTVPLGGRGTCGDGFSMLSNL